MVRTVELHEKTHGFAAGTPGAVAAALAERRPEHRLDHAGTQDGCRQNEPMLFEQLLVCKSGSESGVELAPQKLERSLQNPRIKSMVGGLPSEAIDHCRGALAADARAQ